MPNTMIEQWLGYREQISPDIATAGQLVKIVHLTERDPPGTEPFMYTIGNHQHDLPELLILNTDQSSIADIVDRQGKMQRERGIGFADEERVSLGKFPPRIVDAGEIGRTRSVAPDMPTSSGCITMPRIPRCARS